MPCLRIILAVLAAGAIALTSNAVEAQNTPPRMTDSIRAAIDTTMKDAVRLKRSLETDALDSAIILFDSVVTLTRHFNDSLDSMAVAALSRCANSLYRRNQLDRCDTLLREAIATGYRLFSSTHREIAIALRTYADIERRRNNVTSAETLYVQAMEILTNLRDHSRATESLLGMTAAGLGQLYRDLGRHDEAEPYIRKTIDYYKSVYGPHNPNVAWSTRVLADIYKGRKEYNKAESLYIESIRILELLPQLSRINKERLAYALEGLGYIYLFGPARQYDEAGPIYARAGDLWAELKGPGEPKTAWCIARSAEAKFQLGHFAESQKSFLKALSIYEAHPDLSNYYKRLFAWATVRLGFCYYIEGVHPDKAERTLNVAIQRYQDVYGAESFEVARPTSRLAHVYISQGRLAEAEHLIRRTLELTTPFENPPESWRWRRAGALNNLGRVRMSQGRFDEALSLYKQAAAQWDSLPIPPKRHFAGNIGQIYLIKGMHAEAEDYLRQAVADRIGALRALDASDLALYETLLASLYIRQERFHEADSLLQAAVAVVEQILGPENLRLYAPLTYLAELRFRKGDIDSAKTLSLRSLEIERQNLGGSHVAYSSAAQDLGIIEHVLGNDSAATQYFADYDSDRRKFVDALFTYSSEEQKLRYAAKYELIDDVFLSFAVQSQFPDAIRAASQSLIRGKGRVIDALSAERDFAMCSDNPTLHSTIEQHATVCADIAEHTVALTSNQRSAELAGRLSRMYRLKDSLEVVLSRLCYEYAEALEDSGATVEDIASALPSDALLLDFVRCRAYDFDKVAEPDDFRPARYFVFGIDSDHGISMHDLGEAQRIDSLIAVFRESMEAAPQIAYARGPAEAEAAIQPILAELHSAILGPFANRINAKQRIVVCGDAQLNTLPFDVLIDDQGRYLVESKHFSYVSSSRDLVREIRAASPATEAVVLTSPQYDSIPATHRSAGMIAIRGAAHTERDRTPVRGVECLGTPFAPLPGTHSEGQTVADVIREAGLPVEVHSERDASEAFLKAMVRPPTVLHVATHGYWCSDATLQTPDSLQDNPLIYSGLLLAGANLTIRGEPLPMNSGEDGVLTALEASALNLLGTEIVILSACHTGLGKIQSGEGVFGLRRALHLAGAKSVIMSMFAVPDETTSSLMIEFYSRWLSGRPKSAALREAALSVIADRREQTGAAHPLFWGGFILAGDPD